jgi:hypothetical protein
MNTKSRTNCPECGYKFDWFEKWGFTWYGMGLVRRTVCCPHCHSLLVWRKWPWRIQNITSFALLFHILMMFTKQDSILLSFMPYKLFFIVILVSTIVSNLMLRIETVENHEQKHNQNAEHEEAFRAP